MKTLFSLLLSLIISSLSAQNWETLNTTNKPVARHENAFIECKGSFYLIGGRGIKPVGVYNPINKTWRNTSKPPLEIHHFQAITVNQEIWIIGAMTGKYPNEKALDHILIYEAEKDQWKKGPSIPTERARGACGVILDQNKIYLLGGIVDGHNGGYTAWTDVYDLKTKTWKILADAPHKRDHFAALIYENSIICAGGRQTSKNTNEVFTRTIKEVDIYNIENDTWTTLPRPIPTPRAGCSAVLLNHQAYIIGGESGSQPTAHQEVNIYDFKENKWIKGPSLNTGRHGTQAILFKNSIYICAGSGNRGGSPELNSLEVLR